jgi:hypothetical protein
MSKGPAVGSRQTPTKVCAICDDRFFTQVGLDEHLRLNQHNRTTRRWVTGKHSPANLATLQVTGRRVAELNNARRRRCNGCGLVSTPAAVGIHQKVKGHIGLTEIV